jgi:hypothetical protein
MAILVYFMAISVYVFYGYWNILWIFWYILWIFWYFVAKLIWQARFAKSVLTVTDVRQETHLVFMEPRFTALNLNSSQGDRIGPTFAHWAIVFFGRLLFSLGDCFLWNITENHIHT